MATKNPRISKSGVTTTGRFPLYSNSPETNDADPSLVRLVAGNSLSALYLSSGTDLLSEDIDMLTGTLVAGDVNSLDEESSTAVDVTKSGVPNPSDITIVSNTVVFDAAGIPSVTLVFKIKNSSGETLKAMNAKVELI